MEVLDKRGWHFTIIENSVLESDKLNTYDKLTYVMLCKFGSRDANTCYPSLNLLCKYVVCSRPTLLKSLKALEEIKLIDIAHRNDDKGGSESNIYTLLDVDNIVDKL